MEFGITLPTKADSWKVVERAEKLGFNYAWFYDTHLLSADVLVAMGAAAMKTSKIKLCAGVFIPSNRIAPVAANALATLNALAPGRVVFGVSTGYTGRRTMGLGQIPLARLEKYVEVVEGLLAGKTVEWSEEGGPHKIRFLNPELGLINIKDKIPTFVSAFGPKARALTAKLGAGWIGNVSYPEREKADIEDIQAAWVKNGRNLADFYASASCGGCVLDEGEAGDSKRCMAQAGPFAAIVFHNLVELDQFGSIVPLEGPFPFHRGARGLSQGLPAVRAGGRALPVEPPRPSHVRAAGREAPLGSSCPRAYVHRNAVRTGRSRARDGGDGLQANRRQHRPGAGRRHAESTAWRDGKALAAASSVCRAGNFCATCALLLDPRNGGENG